MARSKLWADNKVQGVRCLDTTCPGGEAGFYWQPVTKDKKKKKKKAAGAGHAGHGDKDVWVEGGAAEESALDARWRCGACGDARAARQLHQVEAEVAFCAVRSHAEPPVLGKSPRVLARHRQ